MTEEPMKSITFSIDSSLENVSLIGGATRGICRYLSLDEKTVQGLELAVTEAVVNAIRHAYDSREGNRVDIRVTVFSDRIDVEIIDGGKGMDPDRLHSLSIDDIDPLQESGRGLAIIRSTVDNVTYESAEGLNRLTLTLFLKATE
jgi:serine/threonine-protein kinase RsbW